MKLYTCQMAKWRTPKKLGIPFLDITVKSGDRVFSPDWKLLSGYKDGSINEEEYTERFKALMRVSYTENRTRWIEVCNMDTLCIACYCGSGKFCHRHLVVDLIESVCNNAGIPFERGVNYEKPSRDLHKTQS